MKPLSRTVQAIALMLASMALFSAMNICIRLAAEQMPSPVMVLWRNSLGLVLVVLWTAGLQRGLPHFPTARLSGHFWRATAGIVAMELWFYAITLLPITLATALSFTTPIFSTIAAMVFLGERAGLRRWSAIGVGFLGMLVILRPGMADFSPDAGFVLMSSCAMAVAGVMVKTLTRTEAPETIVFYMALFMIPWSLLLAFPLLAWPTWHQFLLLLVAFFSTSAHLLMARAYIRTDMVVLMPFDFSRLVFTALMAYPVFGETLDSYTVAGSLVIVASTVYIAQREAKLKRQLALKALEDDVVG